MDFKEFLTDDEIKALEKECAKHFYIIHFLEKNGVLAEKVNVEIIASIRAQANKFLRKNNNIHVAKGKTIKVCVTDGNKRTYDERGYLKEIGLRFDNERKVWVGEVTEDIMEELNNNFTVEVED